MEGEQASKKRPVLANRYHVQEVLGRGGMGLVYRVHDRSSDRIVALKQLTIGPDDKKHDRAAALFQHEYHVLDQLAHPAVVEVYDYGVIDGMPYYTMELLDGKDLRGLAPVPWKEACEILCDACSGLAILHSRRMIHRDLSPRNVRRVSDGRAKLLDFGAMAPMGNTNQVVGTPAYMAPDVFAGRDLDARTDLFSIGALAYWTLTGRHAYPARKMSDLRDVWRTTPPAPSTFVEEVPPALDDLVMSLMSMDPLARPQNCAETIDRMTSIAGLGREDRLEIAQSYLITPSLVGREEQRARFRKRILRAMRGQGGSLLVEARPGMGRSRLLGAFLLEAKLAGALAVRASGIEAGREPYSVIRSLIRSLAELAPELVAETARPHARMLSDLMPDLVPDSRDSSPATEALNTPAVKQAALARWLQDVADQRTLCLVVDDLSRCDAESLSVLVRLASQANKRPMIVVSSAVLDDDHPPPRAAEQIAAAGAQMMLRRLHESESLALIQSVFGDVPNLAVVAAWIYQLAGGNPRTTMELAQYLVDRRLATFSEGSWSLPESLRDQELPDSLEQAMDARFARLSDLAMEVARVLALVTPFYPLTMADYGVFFGEGHEPAEIFSALDELVSAQVLTRHGDDFTMRERAAIGALERGMDDTTFKRLHRQLAAFYERANGSTNVVAYHLAKAGELRALLERLAPGKRGPESISSRSNLFGRSMYGIFFLKEAVKGGKELRLSPAAMFGLYKNLLHVASAANPEVAKHAEPLFAQLEHDSGLVYLDEIDPQLAPMDRVVACLKRAGEAYADTTESQRGLEPAHALRELAVCLALSTSVDARALNVERLGQHARRVEIMAPIAPAIGTLHAMVMSAWGAARHGSAQLERRRQLVSDLSEPIEGIDELTRQGSLLTMTYYLGTDYANMADANALYCTQELAASESYASLGWMVQLLYELYRGRHDAAERCRREMELLSLGHLESELHLPMGQIFELQALDQCDDLMGIKRIWPFFQREARLHEGWRPFERLASAMYHDHRMDFAQALEDADQGLALIEPAGDSSAWHPLMLVRARVLMHLGRHEDALETLEAADQVCADLGISPHQGSLRVREILGALISAHVGEVEDAALDLDRFIEELEDHHPEWIMLGRAYEARARVALLMRNSADFEHYARLAGKMYGPGKMPGLAARYEQLLADARKAEQSIESGLSSPPSAGTQSESGLGTSVHTLLGACKGPEERAQHALEILTREANGNAGYLFGMGQQGPVLSALLNAPSPTADLEERIDQFLEEHLQEPLVQTRTGDASTQDADDPECWALADGRQYYPFVLRSYRNKELSVTGLALLSTTSGRIPVVPEPLLSSLSQALLDAGDFMAVSEMYGK